MGPTHRRRLSLDAPRVPKRVARHPSSRSHLNKTRTRTRSTRLTHPSYSEGSPRGVRRPLPDVPSVRGPRRVADQDLNSAPGHVLALLPTKDPGHCRRMPSVATGLDAFGVQLVGNIADADTLVAHALNATGSTTGVGEPAQPARRGGERRSFGRAAQIGGSEGAVRDRA